MGILDMIARGVSDDIVKGLLAGQGRDRLEQAYRGRAELMALPPAQRPQPRPDRQRLIGQDYANLRPNVPTADPAELYPRGNIGSRLPKGDRGRVLVERGPEIAEALAGRIEASGQLEAPTRMFYHSDGPIYRAAVEAGLSPEDADAFVRDFGQMIAATSPRTNTTQNVQNASSVMAKQAAGIPHRTVIGPGTGGVSEAGYPMMTGEGSLVGQLIDTVVEGGRIDPARNTKPANFASNVSGNRDTATIDTHAVRGILQTLNLIEPGAVPEGYILPPYRSNYSDDPTRLTPDMLDDRPGKQMVDGRSLQTEYPVFADIMHGAAERLGSSSAFDPAENPLLARVGRIGDKPDAVANDAFRVVHDTFGHFGPGNPFFRHQGEERAWVEHSRMFSPEARGAMTSETRGQNSWLNFGPHGQANRTALGADTVFADQKSGLLPEWIWYEGGLR